MSEQRQRTADEKAAPYLSEALRQAGATAMTSPKQDEAVTEAELALREATALAVALHRLHYSHVPQWKPLDDIRGVISQIDNMTTGLTAMRNAAPVGMSEWQDISTAPRDGTRVLVCWSDIPQMAVAAWNADYAEADYSEGVGWRDDSDYGCGGMIGAMPSHWQPLPSPPHA